MDTRGWEARYRSRGRLWSGEPNRTLVVEAAGLTPGRALDVGCGEGADARWLAERGWEVTAVDVSETALRLAAAADHGGGVTWAWADVVAAPPSSGGFDLVSVHYFPLPRQCDHAALRGLLEAVAPGGTFLFVTHDAAEAAERHRPGHYYSPVDIARRLGREWMITVNERRHRPGGPPPGTGHTVDLVLRASRA